MRVLHVVPSVAGRTGGPAFAAAELARLTAAQGIETVLFATDVAHAAVSRSARPVDAEELVEAASDVTTRLFRTRPPRRLVYSPELGRALERDARTFDVVHIHSLYLYPQRAAARAARRADVPYIVSPHGALDPWLRRRGRVRKAVADLLWQRRMLREAAALHFTSEDEARLAADVAPEVPRVVVPLGVRWGEFQRLPEPAPVARNGPVVLNVGRLAAKKGLDVLIRAFARLRGRFPGATLVLAGPDDDGLQPELAAVAREEGVEDRVRFTGMVYGEEKLALLAAADVWALPSHTENFGLAVVEALAAGVPTVVSPAVNLAGEIERAGAGLVAEPEPEPFARALTHLLEDVSRRRAYAERGRAFARRYDWDALAPQIVELYQRVAR